LNGNNWALGHLSQYVFIGLLFVPTVLGLATVVRRGARRAVSSQTALVMAPIVALTITVMLATGEVRYRIPFDVFFISIACAHLVGEVTRVDDAVLAAPARSARVPLLSEK
jgi:hypothetical protein